MTKGTRMRRAVIHQRQIGEMVAVYVYKSDVKRIAHEDMHSFMLGSHIREK